MRSILQPSNLFSSLNLLEYRELEERHAILFVWNLDTPTWHPQLFSSTNKAAWKSVRGAVLPDKEFCNTIVSSLGRNAFLSCQIKTCPVAGTTSLPPFSHFNSNHFDENQNTSLRNCIQDNYGSVWETASLPNFPTIYSNDCLPSQLHLSLSYNNPFLPCWSHTHTALNSHN